MQLPRDLLRLQQQLQQSVSKLELAWGPLVVGVSGGLDSCVLLHLLAQLVDRERHPLVPCYVEHGIRSVHPERQGLLEYCRSLGLELRVFRLPQGWLVEKAAQRGLSLEDLARQERYRRLGYCVRRLGLGGGQRAAGAALLVLAHHAGDQEEGFFMNLLRGSGPCGLAGMREYAALQGYEDVLLWRPLLGWRPRDLQRWAEVHSLPHWEDLSNFCQDTLRNFYRWQVLPQLRRLLPHLDRGLERSREHLALVQGWLERERAILLEQIQVQGAGGLGSLGFVCYGDFTALAAPVQVELFYLLFDRVRAGEQRRRRLPFAFVCELQRQYLEARARKEFQREFQAHGCVWVLSPDCVRVWRSA